MVEHKTHNKTTAVVTKIASNVVSLVTSFCALLGGSQVTTEEKWVRAYSKYKMTVNHRSVLTGRTASQSHKRSLSN